MKRLQPSRLAREDELDDLLHAFFRAELPSPWPAMKAPTNVEHGILPFTFSSMRLLRSRLALAASVALLLSSTLLLPGTIPYTSHPTGRNAPGTGMGRYESPVKKDTNTRKLTTPDQPMLPMPPMMP